MTLTWERPKDPNDVIDYDLDWSGDIDDGDAIATSTWTVPSGTLVIDSNSFTDTATKVWVSAGTADTSYLLTNRVTTTGGRTMDWTVKLRVKQR